MAAMARSGHPAGVEESSAPRRTRPRRHHILQRQFNPSHLLTSTIQRGLHPTLLDPIRSRYRCPSRGRDDAVSRCLGVYCRLGGHQSGKARGTYGSICSSRAKNSFTDGFSRCSYLCCWVYCPHLSSRAILGWRTTSLKPSRTPIPRRHPMSLVNRNPGDIAHSASSCSLRPKKPTSSFATTNLSPSSSRG